MPALSPHSPSQLPTSVAPVTLHNTAIFNIDNTAIDSWHLSACVISKPNSLASVAQVTLHNTALFNMDSNATDGFRKLSHLLQSPPFPPQTFNNLLMLYCKPQHAFYDLAAAVMADNPELVASSLSRVMPQRKSIIISDETSYDDILLIATYDMLAVAAIAVSA